ncbi:MAG: hypothetical protein KDI82_15730 [Gammaproteobacteria bacterium]|nr:hypothetical protein [Gammaproteobacteria bacterium]
MKSRKVLAQIQELLKKSPEKAKKKKLCQTIKALSKKQKELEKKLKRVEGARERERLKQKIEVMRMQRRKGVEFYRQIKSGES